MPVTVTTKGLDKRSSIMDTSQMLKLGTMVEEKIIELGNALMKEIYPSALMSTKMGCRVITAVSVIYAHMKTESTR